VPAEGTANHIVVAGTIASGKTTLAGGLSKILDLPTRTERPEANPFLERFYADRHRWSLASQLWFASDSARQHVEIHEAGGGVQDHSIYENVFVFGGALADQACLAEDEWQLLRDVTAPVIASLPPPAIVVLIEASVGVLMERIGTRGRLYEADVDPTYLMVLNRIRREYFLAWDRSPVLLVDSNRADLRRPEEAGMIAAKIAEHLPTLSRG
jgi:deoxyadenosine/deoxycytidine kinase